MTISQISIFCIITKELGMWKMGARLVPRMLTSYHQSQ